MTNYPTKKLGEVCDILDNLRKPITKRDREPGPYPYYGATGIQDHVNDYIFDEELILVGEDGARWKAGDNSAYKISGKSWVNNHAHVLRPHRNVLIDDWITHFLNISDLSEYITGTTVKKLNQAKLRSIEIPLPPLAEQKKIVAKLEKILEKIKKAKELNKQAQESASQLLPAELHKIFEEGKEGGWAERRLKDLSYQITDGAHHTPIYTKTGVPFISVKNLTRGVLDFTDCKFISRKQHLELSKRCHPEFEDVLLTKVGTTGIARVVDVNKEFSLFVSVALIKPYKELIDSYFLAYCLNSPRLQSVSADGTEGVGNKNLVLRKIKEFEIPLPPIAEQKKIVKRLDSISEKVKYLQKHQETTEQNLRALERSLLQQAFLG